MLLKKIILTSCVTLTLLDATQTLATPPSMPMLNMKQSAEVNTTMQKAVMPKECEMIPPMMILLPPPMEQELVNCQNQLNLPKKEFAEKQLSVFLKKEVTIEKIEIVEKFNQVYKITYTGGIIFTNKSVDKFLQ